MALPVYNQKYFTTKLFSNGKEVQFKPFTVGQQRDILLIRETSTKDSQMYKAVVEMIQECVKDLKIIDLYVIDFEKLFYDIRSVSDGNKIEFTYKCPDKTCKNENTFIVNTKDDFKISNNEFTKKLDIKGTDISINLRQHKMCDLFELENKEYNSEEIKMIEALIYSVDSIIEKEQVIKDFTHEEANKFVNSLPHIYLKKMAEFYKAAPKIEITKTFKCEKCEKEIKIDESEIKYFF